MINYRKLLQRLNISNVKVLYANSHGSTVNIGKRYYSNTTRTEDSKKSPSSSSSSVTPKNNNYDDANKNALIILQNTLQSRIKPFTVTEWKQIRNSLIKTQKFINEINVDATILGLCNSSNHLDIAKSYIEFLKNEGLELNNASLGRLMKIYYLVYKTNEEKLNENDKKDILDIYEMIIRKYKILDSTTCENLIHGIVITDKWKKSLNLLDMIELTCKPSINAYSTIITRAFNPVDGDEDIAWKLLNEMIVNNKQPKCEIFLIYLKRCRNRSNRNAFQQDIEKMLQFLGRNEILITRVVADDLHQTLNEFNIKSELTTISRNGTCNSCKMKMKNISLTNEEFHKLSSVFLDKVLIRKDVFLKSLPEEIDSFVKFVDQTAPYDCVIDGLNVAFSCGTKKNPTVYAKLVASVVKYFVQRKKKVLVIGREHMKKWPKEQMMYIKRNSTVFFTKDLSQDDPFLLYAALKSGPKTDFISRDLMRSHAFLLGTDLKPIFHRWQIEHQYMIYRANENGEVLIKEPLRHYITAHKIDSTWHIPFKEIYTKNPGDQFEIPTNWLCLSF